ncbi:MULTISPECIES: AAA family ATPase [Henriciella]|jgi:RecA-family ATPase|uniref:AAA family ATPase n=1 Tax=Henriciella TaxID=453849 RepID=UPI0035110575
MVDLAKAKEASAAKLTPLFPRRSLESRPWVVRGHAMRGAVSALYGAPGSGKSLLALHLAIAVATGENWGPFEVLQSGSVIIVNREDDIAEMDRRTWAIGQTQNIPDACPVLRLDRPDVYVAVRDQEGKLQRTEFHGELIVAIREAGARLVVLDPMIELSGNLDENSNVDMNFLVETLRSVAAATDCAILMVHHVNKTGTGMNAMRGGSAIAGRVRAAHWLHHLPDNHGLNVDDPRPYRILAGTKANYSENGDEAHFRVEGQYHKDTDEWSPALEPVNLSQKVSDAELANFLDGMRHYDRGDQTLPEAARRFGVSSRQIKTMRDRLLARGALKLVEEYCDRAKRSVPHYRISDELRVPI